MCCPETRVAGSSPVSSARNTNFAMKNELEIVRQQLFQHYMKHGQTREGEWLVIKDDYQAPPELVAKWKRLSEDV